MPRPISAHHPHCLGCGPANPGTLGLRFELDGERVRASLRLADARALFLEVDLEHFAQGGGELPERIREHWARGSRDLPY